MDTKLILDARTGKTGKGIPIKILIIHNRKTSLINTGIRLVQESQWDNNAMRVVNHPYERDLNRRLQTLKAQVDEIVYRLECKGEVDLNDTAEVKHLIEEELDPEKKEKRKLAEQKKEAEKLFISCFDRFVSRHTQSTQNIYKSTRSRLLQWLGLTKLNKLRFEDINIAWLNDFNDFLMPFAPSPNGRGIHFRNIRAVFNDALDREITTNYPFRRFKIKSKPTRKRSFKVEVIREIIKADYLEDWTVKYRDFFILSFCMTGMNVIDLCHLKEIEDGRVNFERAKTHRLYSIKVEPEAKALFDKLKGEDWLIYPLDLNKHYRSFYTRLCKGLKAIKETINAKNKDTDIKISKLTSYWARHTWATIASSIDIPKDTIAHALGHGNNTVTDIYIDFDQNKVDEANRRVLDWVFYGKDWRNPVIQEQPIVEKATPTTIEPKISEIKDEVEVSKSKKGRPKKNTDGHGIPKTTIEQPKKKRGRPKKN